VGFNYRLLSYDLFRNDEGEAFNGTISGNTLTYSGSYTYADHPIYESGTLTINSDGTKIEGNVIVDVRSAGCTATSYLELD
jgi:hypothetical protein